MFELFFTKESELQKESLKNDPSNKKRYKAVVKALKYLESNPKHNSLNSTLYSSLKGPNGEKVFHSYAQQHTPGAYRIFWYYGPGRGIITVLNIVPHPD